MQRVPANFVLGATLLALFSCEPTSKPLENPTVRVPHARHHKKPRLPSSQNKDAVERKDAKLTDLGTYPEFNQSISTACPPWLSVGPLQRLHVEDSEKTFLAVDGVPVCEADREGTKSAQAQMTLSSLKEADRDGDGFPTSLDVLRGAKKAARNGASYRNTYRSLDFPGGDVPRTEGVCTDVIVRSLRNDGIDLQELLALDLEQNAQSYPMVEKPDHSIDHRRVRTLLPYFKRHFHELPPAHDDSAFPLFPGDILFMNTGGDAAPEHLGIVSDRLGPSGFPLVVNNWTTGHQTKEMDLLGDFEVTHRFRVAVVPKVSRKEQGLEGLLRRQKLSLPQGTTQVITITVPTWDSSGGELRLYEKTAGRFVSVKETSRVRIGRAGLGSGRGHSAPKTPLAKQEGDARAPAGVFRLGTAFGRAASPPYAGSWPYRATHARDFWVDDPTAETYNSWQTLASGDPPPWSAERLSMYSLALVVEHNTSPIRKGAGSAIFIHPWRSEAQTTAGCSALEGSELKDMLAWLSPLKNPVLVQTAGKIY